MKLRDIIHASTRQSWTARLVVYIAAIVTAIILFQIFAASVLH